MFSISKAINNVGGFNNSNSGNPGDSGVVKNNANNNNNNKNNNNNNSTNHNNNNNNNNNNNSNNKSNNSNRNKNDYDENLAVKPKTTIQITGINIDRATLRQFVSSIPGFTKIAFYRYWCFVCFTSIEAAGNALKYINGKTQMRATFTKVEYTQKYTPQNLLKHILKNRKNENHNCFIISWFICFR